MQSDASRLVVRQAHTDQTDESAAVAELAARLDVTSRSSVLFFCSPNYDLDKLARALSVTFAGQLIGCTSAGQIGERGYVDGGITALSLTSDELRAKSYLIRDLRDSTEAIDVGYRAAVELARSSARRAFGLLLIDGLSNAEERIAAALFETVSDVTIIGGSAADALPEKGAFVFHDGAFHRSAAVFVVFDTTLPFAAFKVQHVALGSKKLVVTEADAEQRIVYELNGKPAALEYAAQLGVSPTELNPDSCAERPLLLSIGGEHFVRGVRSVNADGSLSFFCAVEVGLVLTLGVQVAPLDALKTSFEAAHARIQTPRVVIGFDCFLRRREFERSGLAETVGRFLAEHHVVGCCTHGEQFDALHMNQTFAGVVIGA